MKYISPISRLLLILPLTIIFFSSHVNAHDPALHKKKNAEKPQCESIKNMDHSTMNMSDPIMLAMMKQCESNIDEHHGTDHSEKGGSDEKTSADPVSSSTPSAQSNTAAGTKK